MPSTWSGAFSSLSTAVIELTRSPNGQPGVFAPWTNSNFRSTNRLKKPDLSKISPDKMSLETVIAAFASQVAELREVTLLRLDGMQSVLDKIVKQTQPWKPSCRFHSKINRPYTTLTLQTVRAICIPPSSRPLRPTCRRLRQK